MVLDHEVDHASCWATATSTATKIGCSAHTLLDWVKKAEVDTGKRVGVPTDVADKLKALERENRELRQANEILRQDNVILASAYFAKVLSNNLRSSGTPFGCMNPEEARRPPTQTMIAFIDDHSGAHGQVI